MCRALKIFKKLVLSFWYCDFPSGNYFFFPLLFGTACLQPSCDWKAGPCCDWQAGFWLRKFSNEVHEYPVLLSLFSLCVPFIL
ncbi:hypothetical protein XELAEV_18013742mg [Xenopus laevis]|uniref:Uncharacterized protein n=1 Tax=Xenopus laevis TaxID=8355 RepID=A0A974DRA6_XENLA|nr:hypothetical protein XELAEV_18013742mg [Xenopus laevis]